MEHAFSADEKVSSYGHYFIVGLSGTTLSDRDKKILSELKPAGILLLARNFEQNLPYEEWHDKLSTLLRDVHQYAERDKLIITLDHEGGRVHRCPPPITKFPTAELYAPFADLVGEAMAVELRSLGVNLSWAPLADIHSNPVNPVIGDRALGTSPEEVTFHAIAMAQALTRNGVLSCAKHFPGHGDTATDSHFELPVVDLDLSQIAERELIPFEALVNWGVPFIMTAHVLFPKIDPENPATLSPSILTNILRDAWDYDGIVIADDLNMKAVADKFAKAGSAATAIDAGCDMFIVARYPEHDNDFPIEVAGQLANSVISGDLPEEVLANSFDRIAGTMQDLLPASAPHLLPKGVFERHAELDRAIRERGESKVT